MIKIILYNTMALIFSIICYENNINNNPYYYINNSSFSFWKEKKIKISHWYLLLD